MSDPIKRPDVDAIRKRAEAASPGPWRTGHGNVYSREGWYIARNGKMDSSTMSALEQPANVQLIAHAKQDVTDLTAYVLELERKNAELEAKIQSMQWEQMGDDL